MTNQLTLRQAIYTVQEVGKRHGFLITIVGGAMVRLISNSTKIQKIDTKSKKIYLSGAENPGVSREEDPTTKVDIDAIAFSTNSNPFTMTVKQQFEDLQKELKSFELDNNFPAISIEPVFYHPPFAEPNSITQFVSSVEKYQHSSSYIFRLGNATQKIHPESLAIWTLYFLDTKEEISTLCPPAIQGRYAIRGFSKKPKDVEKIWGKNSAFSGYVKNFNFQTKHTLVQYFLDWNIFEEKIQKDHHPLMIIKRTLWKVYWATIGTYLAHGTGPIGKILLPLGNTLFAGK